MTSLVFLLLAACTSETPLKGKVVDIWGEPIAGATVVMEGQAEQPLTDSEGRFTLPRKTGKHLLKAGREGYIQEHAEVEITATTDAVPTFKLYQKPKENGFYLVTPGQYVHLDPEPVVSMGNELKQHHGLKTVGDAAADSPLRVVFHTALKFDEINRLGLELHKLEYVRETEIPGTLAPTKVEANLYSSAGEVKFEIKPMRSKTDYLIVAKEPLEPGHYAFQTQDLLDNTNADAIARIPEELRVVFPFEIR